MNKIFFTALIISSLSCGCFPSDPISDAQTKRLEAWSALTSGSPNDPNHEQQVEAFFKQQEELVKLGFFEKLQCDLNLKMIEKVEDRRDVYSSIMDSLNSLGTVEDFYFELAAFEETKSTFNLTFWCSADMYNVIQGFVSKEAHKSYFQCGPMD